MEVNLPMPIPATVAVCTTLLYNSKLCRPSAATSSREKPSTISRNQAFNDIVKHTLAQSADS